MYLRHSVEHPGRWRLSARAVAAAHLLKRSRRKRTVRLREGGKLRVDGSSQTGRIVYATGTYEPATTRIVRKVLRRGDLMVDVGANIGFFCIVAARSVGPGGRVVAFEPSADSRDQLLANVALNRLENVEVHSEALGATSARAFFYPGPAADSGLASLRPLPDSLPIPVSQVRFDDIERGPRPVRLVKIDVEGGELSVLQGMTRCLDADRPDVVVEVTDSFLRTMNGSAAELFGFLQAHGYRMYRIGDDGSLRHIPDSVHLARCPGQFNAYCTTKGEGILSC